MRESQKNNSPIILISPDFPPPFIGGSLVYIHNLLTNSGLKYDVLTNCQNRSNESNLNYIESKLLIDSQSPTRYKLLKMYLYLFFISIKLKKYKVVVLNIGVIGNGLLALLLKPFHVKTVIISYAEEITMATYAKGTKGYIKRLFLNFYKKTNAVVSVSNFAKNILIEKLNIKSPIYVIPTPLHELKKLRDDGQYRRDQVQVLSVGRLIERKGFSHLIISFNQVVKVIPEAKLIIVGNGPELYSLEGQIEKLQLNSSVEIHRQINDSQLASLYGESKLFVLANLMLENGDCEGAPNVIIEAASFGLPVIAGIEGGTSDVVSDGVSGFLINPKNHQALSDKIIELLTNTNLANQMSINSIIKVSRDHNQITAGQKFKDIIKNIE